MYLFIATLYAYGLNMKALDLIYDYLRNRQQRTKNIICIAPGKTYYKDFLKDKFWDLYYLIWFYMIYLS